MNDKPCKSSARKKEQVQTVIISLILLSLLAVAWFSGGIEALDPFDGK